MTKTNFIRENYSAPGGVETILVVEDEAVVREMERHILESCGYHVLEASCGKEALDLWNRRTAKIDLLLTDIVMPHSISGAELAKQLLARQPHLKVILTSGYATTEINNETLAETNARFLPKPYNHTDLAKAVRDALDGTALYDKSQKVTF